MKMKQETIPCIVQTRKNDTGEIRDREMDVIIDPDNDNGPLIFYFSEGNASWDCNRAIDFYAAGGEKIDFDGVLCSDGKYSIRLTGKETGEVFYDEFDD